MDLSVGSWRVVCRTLLRSNKLKLLYESPMMNWKKKVEDRTFELGMANEELEHEIGERVRMEETLRERNSMLQTLIHAIPDQVFFKDSGGSFFAGQQGNGGIHRL